MNKNICIHIIIYINNIREMSLIFATYSQGTYKSVIILLIGM